MAEKEKTKIVLSGVNKQVFDSLMKGGIIDFIDRKNILDNITDAISRSEEILNEKSRKV